MVALHVKIIPSRQDNYIYLLHNAEGECVVVDPGEAAPVLNALREHQLTPVAYWLTHHHYDHIDGLPHLLKHYPLPVYGFAGDSYRIPHITEALQDGASFTMFQQEVRVRHIPGHTLGHIYFYLPQSGVAFVGDTLFSLGCGRLFEGDAASMYSSLQMIARLPTETLIYTGHEYTLANAAFALAMEPSNPHVIARKKAAEALRAAQQPTMPTTLHSELQCNPFLRCNSTEIRSNLKMPDSAGEIDVFAALRRAKDSWGK